MSRLDDVVAALREVREAEATTELAREVEKQAVFRLAELVNVERRDKDTVIDAVVTAEQRIIEAALSGELAT